MTPTTDTPVLPSATRTRAGRRALVAALLALGVLAVGCSDSDSDDNGASGTSEITEHDDDHTADDGGDASDEGAGDDRAEEDDDRPASADGVPKECSIYPFAMEPADPDEISLTPDRWPAPPSGATLCVTSSAIGSSTEVAEYALAADRETILGYYEAQLGGAFNLEREAGIGAGEILTGYDDTVGFQISTREGGFKIAFSEM